MVIAKRRNDCVDEAIKQKNKALSKIVEHKLSREEKNPNYEVTYTLKDLNRSTPRNSTRRTVHRLTLEERKQRRQRYQQRDLSDKFKEKIRIQLLLGYPQAVSPRRSPEQVTPRVVTPPNNWDQLQNIRTFYQPLDFNLLNQQLAEANLTASDSSDSSDTDTEDEMTNAVLDYLEDNLHNHTSLRVDPFYGDGTQDPLQWMIYFEKVARSNA
ncbi:hypothetical protein Glove_41g154 [Diversispora epigaea]|uniref:Uncharacterized protein n=1 Tax=Diversispora epigaea TaxID=1348612 RepID=A0A397JRE3_9GLOM|nr:hypothetical protein Glove_41g154 [Diversispora epigaea]